MGMTGYKSVDEYVSSQPEAVQGLLEQVRSAVRKALPKAEESISYKIPTYKQHGRPVLYFAVWKRHYSLYPADARLAAEFQKDLAQYEVEKGTIRFPLSEPVPARLIGRIAKFRLKEVVDAGKARTTALKNR